MIKKSGQEIWVNGDVRLAGTLTLPAKETEKMPAIVIISGSGKSDRNGNPNRSIRLSPYEKLAHALVQQGYAVLRYDKRGCGKSEGKFVEAGLQDLINDAVAAFDFLVNHPAIDRERIFLLGHSEGAMIAPVVSLRRPVKGLMLVAGAFETLEITMKRQQADAFKAVDEMPGIKGNIVRFIVRLTGQKNQFSKLLDKIRSTDKPVIRIMGIVPFNAKWVREHLAFDIRHVLPEVTVPLIALTGDRDIQVIPQDARRIAEACKGPSRWAIIPEMNHLLQPYQGQHTMMNLVQEYIKNPDQRTHPELIRQLTEWLSEQ